MMGAAGFIVLAALMATPFTGAAQGLTLSGGLDLRAGLEVAPRAEGRSGLSSAFFNLRKVFADAEADRFFLVAQVDVEEEVAETHLYNVYGQYKGGLGRWNVRVGRYLVPFGLHAYFDTERLLLAAHEAEALGVKLDEGAEVFGFSGSFDYAFSVTSGLDGATPIARLGWQGEDLRFGVSYLRGRLPSFADRETVLSDELLPGARLIFKHRVAIDYEHTIGPLTVRAEPIAGTDAGELAWGGYLEASYALSPDWELSANAAHLDSGLTGTRYRAGASLGFRLLPAVFLRAAFVHRDDFGTRESLFLAQLYADFSQSLGE